MLVKQSFQELARSTSRLIPQVSIRIRAMSNVTPTPKRFAPLDPREGNAAGAPPLKGIVFDVDGTLWYAFHNEILDSSPRCGYYNLSMLSLCF